MPSRDEESDFSERQECDQREEGETSNTVKLTTFPEFGEVPFPRLGAAKVLAKMAALKTKDCSR